MMRIREAAEKAKIELSYDTSTEIILPYLAYSHPTGPINLVLPITRQDLEKVVSPIIERCRSPMMQAINDAKLNPGDVDKIILIGGPTRMPIITQFVRNVVGKEPEKGIDPMEAVAKGAAIQGALLAGEIVDDIQLMDVTPLTLGVEILGEKIEPLIEKNTTVPTRKSRVFTTANDYQTSVTIHIVQGEGENASDCASLGMFTLSGIPPTLKGVPQVEVSFQYHINGILDVTAKDLATSKKANITISTEAKLSEEEVEKLRKDSNYKRKGKENLEIAVKKEQAQPEQTLSSLGTTLEVVDKVSTDLQQTNNIKPEREAHLEVTSKTGGGVINVKEGDQIVETITADKLARLGVDSHRLIKVYEKSIVYYYNIWTEVYPTLAIENDPISKARIRQQLNNIVESMCLDWHKITHYLKDIEIDLTAKYPEIEYICKQAK